MSLPADGPAERPPGTLISRARHRARRRRRYTLAAMVVLALPAALAVGLALDGTRHRSVPAHSRADVQARQVAIAKEAAAAASQRRAIARRLVVQAAIARQKAFKAEQVG